MWERKKKPKTDNWEVKKVIMILCQNIVPANHNATYVTPQRLLENTSKILLSHLSYLVFTSSSIKHIADLAAF